MIHHDSMLTPCCSQTPRHPSWDDTLDVEGTPVAKAVVQQVSQLEAETLEPNATSSRKPLDNQWKNNGKPQMIGHDFPQIGHAFSECMYMYVLFYNWAAWFLILNVTGCYRQRRRWLHVGRRVHGTASWAHGDLLRWCYGVGWQWPGARLNLPTEKRCEC